MSSSIWCIQTKRGRNEEYSMANQIIIKNIPCLGIPYHGGITISVEAWNVEIPKTLLIYFLVAKNLLAIHVPFPSA